MQTTAFPSKVLEITLYGEFHSMNEVISANRKSRFLGAEMKQEGTENARYQSLKAVGFNFKTIDTPMFIEFHWYCKNKKKDPDNISSAKKQILDGFQKSKVISGDGWKNIIGFSDHFYIDKNNERCVTIIKY